VIEDACQAHGAEYRGQMAGSIGDAGCFSFYPGKNLGAYGEAGAVVTNNGDLAQKLRILRDHGQPQKYVHAMIGWNGRMDGIQAAVLSVKLRHLPAGNEARRAHARAYGERLAGTGSVAPPCEADYAKHVYHVYAVRVSGRDAVMRRLQQRDIGCGIHYPIPLHLQEAYRSLACAKEGFPVAERCAREFLSLPMFPELSSEQLVFVAETLKSSV
jgi:dTDP-4-amino-4,6-dideoxygalactose transaminase